MQHVHVVMLLLLHALPGPHKVTTQYVAPCRALAVYCGTAVQSDKPVAMSEEPNIHSNSKPYLLTCLLTADFWTHASQDFPGIVLIAE